MSNPEDGEPTPATSTATSTRRRKNSVRGRAGSASAPRSLRSSRRASSASATPTPHTKSAVASTSSSTGEFVEASLTIRRDRRRSMDPPLVRESAAEITEGNESETSSRRIEPTATVKEEEQVETVPETDTERSSTQDVARQILPGPTVPDPSSAAERNFELLVVQQPEIGAEAGLERVTLGRLPIIPAPIVQVVTRDAGGQLIEAEMPYLFCSCSLKQTDGITAVENPVLLATGDESGANRHATSVESIPNDPNEEFSSLVGGLVRNVQRVRNMEGEVASYFVFEDMSVRASGTYTLEFRLGEARPKSPRLAAVVSESFLVVPWDQYPGRPVESILTPLSRHLHEQGVPMYIPALVLSSLEPGPPSTNPFPILEQS